jgi:hypothetical protein
MTNVVVPHALFEELPIVVKVGVGAGRGTAGLFEDI